MKQIKNAFIFGIIACGTCFMNSLSFAQVKPGTDASAPLHLLQPDYPIPYGAPKSEAVKQVLDRVYNYLDSVTPVKLINRKTGAAVSNPSKPDTNIIVQPGDFRLMSYEWGVTYSGMLRASETTGDAKYAQYVKKRLDFLASVTPYFKTLSQAYPQTNNPLHQVIHPRALDDAGAVSAAMIKATNAGLNNNLRPLIDNYLDFISNKEFRLPDGTLARNRPQKNTMWLDDLYMSIPALSQMFKLTGDKKYLEDAVKQLLQFSARMFNKEKGLFMHGWVQEMDTHPEFRWARANGWAILATVELLEVLPEDHSQRKAILDLLKAHAKGLASYQSGMGFWHQLIDRNDSYLETSATAIYTYCIARAINKGWLDPLTYGPMVTLAWNAVSTKVNKKGQVEGTCVGTGMGFDPAFYYYRPVNVYAAHGYGPVLLAGAEMIELLKSNPFKINDSSVQYYKQ